MSDATRWLECPCCSWEAIAGQLICVACQVPLMHDPEPGDCCEAGWAWWDGDEATCPHCGCRVRVSADGEEAWTVLVCEDDDATRAACPCAECAP